MNSKIWLLCGLAALPGCASSPKQQPHCDNIKDNPRLALRIELEDMQGRAEELSILLKEIDDRHQRHIDILPSETSNIVEAIRSGAPSDESLKIETIHLKESLIKKIDAAQAELEAYRTGTVSSRYQKNN